jgi:L,D-peptidoglycan transpeptidase YkuD (ErfK/YbiS/YcfS/YnhG family)
LTAGYFPDEGYPAALERLAEGFADYAGIPAESRRAALRMCYDGIIVGSGDSYRPLDTMTRAEAAAIIARLDDKSRRLPRAVPALAADTLKAAENSGQIITVTVKSDKDYKAKINVYEEAGGVWLRKYTDIEGVTGSRGVMENRRQGTYTSPAGNYGFVFAFGAKENPGVHAGYEYREITEESYWVLDRNHALYNRWTEGKGDFGSSEHLTDFGYQYNYAMVIDLNYEAPVKGDGGAIFMHVATTDGKGTGGCVAMSEEDLLNIMKWLDPDKNPRIIICTEEDLDEY